MGAPPPCGHVLVVAQRVARGAARVGFLMAAVLALAGPGTAPRAVAQSGGSAPTATPEPLIASVSPALATRGWYAEAGGGAESRTLERLVRRLRAGGSPWGLVALRQPPAEGTRSFAEDVLDSLGATQSDISTVVVLTPSDIAAESRTYAADALDQAITQAIPDFQRDVTAGYERLFELLAGAPLTDELAPIDPAAGRAPGRSTVPLFVAGGALLAAAAVVVVVVVSRRAARS